ncbi:MAG: hypothetical protein U9N52_05320 [Campylobacterota bacterium]|nr:hypothetical protein [Campylobacterota bacterium]
MSYLLGLGAVGIFFLVLHNFTELDHKQKGGATAVLLGLIIGMYVFNLYSDGQRNHVTNIVLEYQQKKTLTCKGIDVNITNFSYSVGTQTFIGRENTPHYGRLISATECE